MVTPLCGFGVVDGRPLFLDLAADQYYLLEPDAEARFFDDVDLSGNQAATIAPAASILDQVGPPGLRGFSDMIPVATLVVHARTSLRQQALVDQVASLTSALSDPPSWTDPRPLAVRFASARRLLPIENHCLHDSLALLRFLRRRRSAATLVYGAKLDPFAAHCWVQAGDTVLNDRVERIAAFTPVLVAGP